MEAFFDLLHPDVELREEFIALDVAVYRGHDGVREWLRRSGEVMSGFQFEPQRYMRLEDSVVIPIRLTARGAGSGAEVTADLVHMGQMRDGKISLLAAYPDLQSAVHAAATDIETARAVGRPRTSSPARRVPGGVVRALRPRRRARRQARPRGDCVASSWPATPTRHGRWAAAPCVHSTMAPSSSSGCTSAPRTAGGARLGGPDRAGGRGAAAGLRSSSGWRPATSSPRRCRSTGPRAIARSLLHGR